MWAEVVPSKRATHASALDNYAYSQTNNLKTPLEMHSGENSKKWKRQTIKDRCLLGEQVVPSQRATHPLHAASATLYVCKTLFPIFFNPTEFSKIDQQVVPPATHPRHPGATLYVCNKIFFRHVPYISQSRHPTLRYDPGTKNGRHNCWNKIAWWGVIKDEFKAWAENRLDWSINWWVRRIRGSVKVLKH